jgi:hypothetical protein
MARRRGRAIVAFWVLKSMKYRKSDEFFRFPMVFKQKRYGERRLFGTTGAQNLDLGTKIHDKQKIQSVGIILA